MSAAKSTPTPWLVFEENEIIEIQAGKDGQPIVFWLGFDRSDVPLATRRANAHRIVQCVNAHDDLVEALDKLAHYAECQVAAFSAGRPHLDMTLFPRYCAEARAALAKAGSDGETLNSKVFATSQRNNQEN